MDKYGIVLNSAKVQRAREEGKCPDCGAKMSPEQCAEGRCPVCGTEPFELKESKNYAAQESNTIYDSLSPGHHRRS